MQEIHRRLSNIVTEWILQCCAVRICVFYMLSIEITHNHRKKYIYVYAILCEGLCVCERALIYTTHETVAIQILFYMAVSFINSINWRDPEQRGDPTDS